MKAYTPAHMRAADKYTIEKLGVPGSVLMDRAAESLFTNLGGHLGHNKLFVILCGKGNNGGDGWALAYKLSSVSERVVCVSVFGNPSTDDALYFFEKCIRTENHTFPVKIINAGNDIVSAINAVKKADVIIEAIFGTGFSGSIEKDSIPGKLIEEANNSPAYRMCADIPGGADALTGKCEGIVFNADVTVTFAKPKPGMFSYPARGYCGKIIIADIGIPESVFESFDTPFEIADDTAVRSCIPKRYANSNKGSYGKLLIHAGSRDMTGAAHLALSGALRSGAGLVISASDPYVNDILKSRISEPVFLSLNDSDTDTDKLIDHSKKCTAILIGCGLGTSNNTKKRVSRLIKECKCPIILDADGINCISDNINIITEAGNDILLTPHPLEFSRISGQTLDGICANRLVCAMEFSEKYNCTVLLKGANTVICEKGKRVCIIPVACSALAKGGSGDVLSGMIASFASQGAPLFESAVAGAYLHARAGEILAAEYSEYGVMPSDIPMAAARILSEIM